MFNFPDITPAIELLRRGVIALELIALHTERIAIAVENDTEGANRQRAIDAWAHGQGKHPDD